MPDNISAPQRAALGAVSGFVRKADGTSYDWQAALEAITAAVGGDAGDIDALIAIATSQLTELEAIDVSTAATVVINTAIQTAVEAIQVLNTSIDASNTNIETAVQIIDNMIGAIGAAHTTGVSVVGMKAESTVPTEVADGQAVAVWGDTFGRLVQLFTDVAQNAASVSDISPAQMQVARWNDWAALTAPNDETPEANVQDYENHTVQYTIATIDDSVDLIIWGSIDGGATWFPMSRFTVLAADEQTDTVTFRGVKVERIKCEFDGEAGGVAAVVTFALMSGN